MDVGDTATLEIRLDHSELGELRPPRAAWESSDPGIVRLEPIPANSGNPVADSLAARRTRIRAIAVASGSAVITVRVEATAGSVEAERSFDVVVRLWKQAVGFLGSTCGLTARGVAYCWGAPIGTESKSHNADPRVVAVPFSENGLRFRYLASGQTHVCGEGFLIAGLYYCWGLNFWGQLTNGTVIDEIFPVPINSNGLTLTDVSVADEVSCGIGRAFLKVADRTQMYCWGQSLTATGPSRSDSRYPDLLSAVDPEDGGYWGCDFSTLPCLAFYDLAVGERHACALYQGVSFGGRSGSVVCWGNNAKQQIGRPSSLSSRRTMGVVYQTAVPAGVTHSLSAIVSNRAASCVLDQGSLFCWGDFFGATPTPVLADVGLSMITASADGDQVCGVGASDGKAYCIATSTGQTVPTSDLADDGTRLRFLSIMTAGRVVLGTDLRHYCGITVTEGGMYCWGDNTYGQLGRDTRGAPVAAPVRVQTPITN